VDNRVFPRLPVNLQVSFRDDRDLRESMVESVSGGGVYMMTCPDCGWKGSPKPSPVDCPTCGSRKVRDDHCALPRRS